MAGEGVAYLKSVSNCVAEASLCTATDGLVAAMVDRNEQYVVYSPLLRI